MLCGTSDADTAASGYDFEYDTVANRFSFVSCRTCGHQYLSPRPSGDDLAIIYPSTYYALSGPSNAIVRRAQRVWESRKVRMYRSLVGAGPKRILDIGCGNGRFLSVLRDFGPAEWQLVGVDFDEAGVAQCIAAGFEAHAVRVEDFTECDASFDAVIMLQLIEHVEDPAAIARRVYSLLRPGGYFVVETPNLGGLDYRLFRGRYWGHYHFPRHWNLFSTSALGAMLEAAGFEVTRTEYLISTSAWTISLHNYFRANGYSDRFVRFFSYQNPLLLPFFVLLDSCRARLGLETSNQRVVAHKPL